jgi:iron complex transport system ATP-binding protein
MKTTNLHIGYNKGKKNQKVIAENLNLHLEKGKLVSLLGANGSGKSTLIQTLAGALPALKGDVLMENKSIQKFSSLEIAKMLSLVFAKEEVTGNLTVYELVSLGRYPHTGWLGKLTQEDESKIEEALEMTHTTSLMDCNVHQISEGERQKVWIARALAQDTPLIMLDEPTAHLDLPNRMMIFQLLKQLAKEMNKAVLLCTHELELALQHSDEIWLLYQPKNAGKKEMVCDSPENIIENKMIERAFFQNNEYELQKSASGRTRLSY